MSKLLEYMQNANHPADVYIEKASDDSSADDSSSSEGSGFLSGLRNFLGHPFQGSGTVIAPNYTPRPLDDSVYSDIPGTPVASGQFGELEDESVRDERMKDSADYMAANWPRLYGGAVGAAEGFANVVGGIQNAVGGGNGILTNVQRAEEGMQNYREQWNNEYGDSYFLNPNKFATDAGSVIGSSVPIMAFSGLMPGAAVAGGTRALTSALSRAGLGRLAMSKAGQALIADTVRSIPTSNLADSLSEYGTVVNDMMQNGVSEDEARRRAIPMFFKNMALDTFTVPLELGVMKGGKGIATGLLGRGAEEGIGKSLAKGAARTGMLAGASGLTEGYQEGAQNALENDVQGKRDGGWYNPFTWTNEDWEAARGGFVGGALMGIPGNVAAGFHPEAKQAPLSAESQEQAQSIKDTLSHGKPKGMSNAAYNAYIELANSGNPDLIKQAASSLESFQESQGNSSSESTDDAATEAYRDYEAYDQKQEIENFLNNNTVEQIGGEDNYNWLYGVLRNGTPEEVQKAYDTVIAAEKATAEQEAKNRPARSGGSVSPNTGNAMVNAVIQAANDSGVDPRLALAIAARESGGDDINAIHMPDPHDGIYGIMQAQDETVSDLGLDSQYPDWKTDPYQNAMVGMAILKSKIANEDGDVWAGVRDYNGAGEEAEQYRQLVKNNYDNMGDIGGGGGNATYDGLQLTLPDSDEFTDQSGNVSGLTEDTRMKLRVLDNLCYQKFGQHLIVSSSYREGDPNNHGAGVAFDVSGGIVDDPDARQWLEQAGPAVGLFVIPEYQGEAGAEFAHGDNVHFSNVEPGIYGQTRNAEGHWSEEHAAPSIQSILKGGASSGVSSKAAGDNGQFERELDQAAQEAKSDMDKIQAQSDQAMNEIMNDNSAEKTAQEAQEDAENAQKQAEESQQSTQDAVIPDVAQTIRDTSNNIDEINTLDGMFTKDSNGNDKFIDTPENRDYIKTNYKDEIDAAVKKAMQKTTAPKIKTQKKEDLPIVDGTSDVGPAARFMKSPHARLGNILADYDRNDPKFKGYMETFRHGTDEQQAQLADQLQQAQEQAKANSTTSNATVTTPSPANPSQQAVQAPKPAAQVNTPTPTQTAPKKAPKAQYEWGMRGYHWSGELNDKGKINIREADMSMYDSDMQFDVAKIQKAIAKAKTEEEARGIIRNIAKNTYGAHVERLRMKIGGNASVEEWRTKHKESPEIQEVYDDLTKGLTNLYEQATGKALKEQFAEKAPTKAVEAPKKKPTTNNTETPKETPQKEKVEEKKGEVKHEENKGNNVNTEPQQTESEDKESSHAEEGSQSDVQEEVSKFHDLLNSKESTPRKVVDAYKRLADAVITDAKDNPSKATAGEKIITDNRDLAINDYKIRDVFIKRRLQREITAVYDNANEELRAITESAGKEKKSNAVSDEDDYHGFLDGKKEVVQKMIRSSLNIKHNPFGNAEGIITLKHTMEVMARSNGKHDIEVRNGKTYIDGTKVPKVAVEYYRYLRKQAEQQEQEAPKVQTSHIEPFRKVIDDLSHKLQTKELTPKQAQDKLKQVLMDAAHATYGTFDDMSLVKTDQQLTSEERAKVNSMVNDAMAVANKMSVEASRKRVEKKAQKETPEKFLKDHVIVTTIPDDKVKKEAPTREEADAASKEYSKRIDDLQDQYDHGKLTKDEVNAELDKIGKEERTDKRLDSTPHNWRHQDVETAIEDMKQDIAHADKRRKEIIANGGELPNGWKLKETPEKPIAETAPKVDNEEKAKEGVGNDGQEQGKSADADGRLESVGAETGEGNDSGKTGKIPGHDGQEAEGIRTSGNQSDSEGHAAGTVPARTGVGKDDSAGTGERGNKQSIPLTPAQAKPSAEETPGHDYTIGNKSQPKDEKSRYKQNVKAIKLLKQLEAEDRMPTPTEQKVLGEYNGWGGLKDAFKEGTPENKELRELLTDEEYKAAQASSLDAFYTPAPIVKAIWKGVKHLGFTHGRVLDPSMGTGNFFGNMPQSMRKDSQLYGVEMDNLTARFAKMLYPSAAVENAPFQRAVVGDNYFDLVISNIPFSQVKVQGYQIHNFFFANGIDKVRPGGLMVFITSQGSLTGRTDAARMRHYLAGEADLIGAFKLPSGTFTDAGTDVATDVVVFRKRDKDKQPSKYANSFVEIESGGLNMYNQYAVNEYFKKHEDNILGDYGTGRDQFGNTVMKVTKKADTDVAELLEKGFNRLPKDVYQPINRSNEPRFNPQIVNKKAVKEKTYRDGEYHIENGEIYQYQYDKDVKLDIAKTGKVAQRIKGYIAIKKDLNALYTAQRDVKATDKQLAILRKKLNKDYDAFVKKNGYLNNPLVTRAFIQDPDAGMVLALERNLQFAKKGNKKVLSHADKADVFTMRTMNPKVQITKADKPDDALIASLQNKGYVDMDYMSQLLGGEKPEVIAKALGSKIFKDPVTEDYVARDEYLSGNVREKYSQAVTAAVKDSTYQRNVDELKKVIPKDLVPEEIMVNLGSPWVPPSDVQAFVDSITNRGLDVEYYPTLAKWTVSGWDSSAQYRANGIEFSKLLEAVLNNKAITIYKGAKKDNVVDREATDAANATADRLREDFRRWLWSDKDRAKRLARYYNDNFNNTVLREYDGSHLTFPWINPEITLRPHQKDAVWRMLTSGNTLVAHCVGAGKTWEMQAAGMEMRRLGIANKPLYCVPNNVVKQFADEFRQLCPEAKLLVIKSGDDLPAVKKMTVEEKTEDGRKKKRKLRRDELTKEEQKKLDESRAARNRALARIQTEDWDGIIMSHTMFERLPVSPETKAKYIQQQLDILEQTVKEAKDGNMSKRDKSNLEARKETLKEKLNEALDDDIKDIGIPFEELGIDQIFVDEADLFKNLHYETSIGGVSGLTNSDANRSQDMFLKTQWLTETRNGRGVVFATGTPISNTIAELYTMSRYLVPKMLKEHGVNLFDSWIRTFAEIGTGIERKPSGDGFRKVNRVKNFINMAELTTMFRSFADIKTQDELHLNIPKLKNGKPTTIALDADPAIVNYIKTEVPKRIANIKANAFKMKKGADNMLSLTNDLRHMTMTDAKINACADNIADVFNKTTDVKGAQLVFCDYGIPKAENEKAKNNDTEDDAADDAEKENGEVYARLMQALRERGIPSDQIAFVQSAKNKDQQRELFEKVDNGEIRILIGSTSKMGAGTNCQHHLVALHDLDAPWRPRDLEQRHGRILRQGNLNDEVEIFNYVIKDSFDANMWEKLKNKASIIAQAMSKNTGVRVVEDADMVTLSYADVENAATGNPLIKKRLTMKGELTKLTNASRQFAYQVRDAEYDMESLPKKIEAAEHRVELIESDIKALKDTSGDNFVMKIMGHTYTKRKDAMAALEKAAKKFKNTPTTIGEIGGLRINGWIPVSGVAKYQIVGNFSYDVLTGSVAGMENTLRALPRVLTDEKEHVDKLKARLSDDKKIVEQKNPYTEKLAKVTSELAAIDKAIENQLLEGGNATKETKPEDTQETKSNDETQYSVRDAGETITRTKEAVKAEMKEAFKTASNVLEDGDRLTFTMPNGQKITVDVRNGIAVTDEELAQAKKDHDIDGNVVVEGYAQTHGKDAYIAVAQGSREGTGFHEAYHIAEKSVLTDKEKAAITKAIPDAEKRADKYAEWIEARKHGRGTAWGKLFQKIKDFAAKMKKIFTGTETVNNIFRQIESGRVWERNVREQGTKQSNQPLYQAKHIVSTFADKINLNRFVNAVLTHNEKSLIMHLGKVDADEAVAIKEATGYDVSNYEHVWRSNDVRHAQKRHGIDTETASDQIGLSPEEMVDALKVISAPDKIERGSINKEGPSIRYIKADNNGQLTIVEVVRSKRKTLDIKTMWKKRAEKLHGDYALQDTSETALDATSSTTENVAHNTDNVNGEKHYSIRKPKDAADEAQEKAEQAAEDTAVTMKDILAAARKILPIYTRSKIHYNSRATYRYDEHGRAGFVPSNYTLGDIGASIALHLDHVAQLKGANVELTNDVLDELEIEQRAAKKYKQEAPKAMTPVEARREGVKEFGRIYFQDPARAKEKYPKYYDIFEKTLDGMPEEKAAVEKILELEAQRAAQNPLLLATAGLSLADDRKKPKTVKERLNTAWARFYRTMVDETDPLRQITKCIEMELGKKLADEKDPHKRAVMCNSVAEGRASMLLFADNKAANLAYLNKIYKGAIRDKVTFEDVLNTLRKVRTEDIKKAAAKDVETYFGMYLVAQRTEEIVKTHKNYVRPEGYSHENCLRIIAEAPEAIRKAAQLYWKYNRNLVNIMEAEGLISEKQAAGLRKYEKYCPMYRDMSEHRTFDDELPTITAGRGFINQSSGIKKLKGGSILAVINPIDSMVSMTTALIARCERNDVAKVMVQSAEDHPGLGRIIVKDPSLFRADASKCAFTVMIAGKKTVYRTTPELYQALQEMSTNSAAFLTNVFGKFTDALRFGATNTPSFMVRNFIRDTLSASVNARYGKFVPIVDSIRGMKALKGDADFRAKFYGQGVPMDTYIRRDIRGAKQYKDKVQKSLKRYPLGIRQLMALSRSLVHKYNDVGEALEQGTRAGAMLNALKAGASDFEAGQEARDVTVNFSRHGSFGKKVNRYVPFFNASIQGTDKVIRTFLENPKRASLATCLYIILPTIILWAINHDDDWYKELDDNTKYTNWAVHIPGTDYHWLIPKPQEVGIGFGSGVEAVLNQMLNEDPHAMKAWARQFAEVVTPGIIMTALRPVLEWRYNYSEWTGRKLVPERLSKLPPEQQYTTATSELAKLMSQFAGKYVGLSPIAIDNFFSGWFGSLGRMSANALNKPIDAIRGSSRPPEPARYWYESPFIGSFARQDGQNSVYVERFYQLAEDMEMDYKRSDSYAKNKGKKGAPIPASLKAAQTCMKTMTKINKDIRSIKDDPKMDPETKRKRIDAAYTKMRTYAKKFVTQYDK
ncbi:LPD38 domain-containing protein [Megasphaera elsdenii]|uniref:LPD38 domain-containing protein n=2 Tax=Megasphaera TaxID=906 RepID=UPI00242C0C81|nr:LPD38 domain-containing protein [Megasphaera elsdenii]